MLLLALVLTLSNVIVYYMFTIVRENLKQCEKRWGDRNKVLVRQKEQIKMFDLLFSQDNFPSKVFQGMFDDGGKAARTANDAKR